MWTYRHLRHHWWSTARFVFLLHSDNQGITMCIFLLPDVPLEPSRWVLTLVLWLLMFRQAVPQMLEVSCGREGVPLTRLLLSPLHLPHVLLLATGTSLPGTHHARSQLVCWSTVHRFCPWARGTFSSNYHSEHLLLASLTRLLRWKTNLGQRCSTMPLKETRQY